MKTEIEWRIGTPTERGCYLLVMDNMEVFFDKCFIADGEPMLQYNEMKDVIAYYPVHDIEVCKK